jgi:hypothetical protein
MKNFLIPMTAVIGDDAAALKDRVRGRRSRSCAPNKGTPMMVCLPNMGIPMLVGVSWRLQPVCVIAAGVPAAEAAREMAFT